MKANKLNYLSILKSNKKSFLEVDGALTHQGNSATKKIRLKISNFQNTQNPALMTLLKPKVKIFEWVLDQDLYCSLERVSYGNKIWLISRTILFLGKNV